MGWDNAGSLVLSYFAPEETDSVVYFRNRRVSFTVFLNEIYLFFGSGDSIFLSGFSCWECSLPLLRLFPLPKPNKISYCQVFLFTLVGSLLLSITSGSFYYSTHTQTSFLMFTFEGNLTSVSISGMLSVVCLFFLVGTPEATDLFNFKCFLVASGLLNTLSMQPWYCLQYWWLQAQGD